MRRACIGWAGLLVTATLVAHCAGANILALLTTPSRSHHIWNRVLVRALAARGHHVTVLSPDHDALAGPNVTQVLLEDAYWTEQPDYDAISAMSQLDEMLMVFQWGKMLCDQGMASKGVRSLLALKDARFDLAIVEVVSMECYLGIVHRFGSPPVVAITAYSRPDWADWMLGETVDPATVPSIYLPYTDRMHFTQRAHNLFMALATKLYRQWVHMPAMDAAARRTLGDATPPVAELERNVSVVLVNAQIGFDYPRATVPGIVPVGGLHLRAPQPLPQDLQQWMDGAQHGVIFFSLGSNIRSDQLSPGKMSAVLAAFGRLQQRVLWKFESAELPPGLALPSNVRLGAWLPQTDVLAHARTVLFISHCGLLSAQEAVYFGVPVVGVPVFADQHTNMARLMARGVAEGVAFTALTADSIVAAVEKVLGDHSYHERMRTLSAQFRDLPLEPLQSAVFWTEYTLRHGGAAHLRTATETLSWPQRCMLDVAAAAALLVALAACVLRRLVCSPPRSTVQARRNKRD